MSSAYVLSKAAAADLRQIVRYTRQQWGHGQVLSYVHQLQTSITRLAAEPSVGKDLSELYPDLRVLHCQHHYVFCLPREVAPLLVIAIFHERMDLMARLAHRLQ